MARLCPSVLSTLISFLVLDGVGIFGKIHYVWRLRTARSTTEGGSSRGRKGRFNAAFHEGIPKSSSSWLAMLAMGVHDEWDDYGASPRGLGVAAL